ncbi:MAG: class I SAM-dependent methyltransferase [Dermatophilaceae bacterium]|nr:class I SAM-dependent methyltransferase [Actinomycetales bacterium]MBP8881035.1 class I SAM-dependent methyltransferase [Dermatophilaceae bacterium]MBP9919303.1 class I SAM-dependent methyltransferase [Dermatophilaceae bacterium]
MTDFDAEARTWDDKPDRLERSRAVADAIRAAIPLRRDWLTLEYGAGTGQLSRELADDLGPVTLADASAGMTEVAAERIVQSGLVGWRAIQLDLMHDPLPTQRYDLVLSLMAMHHVDDVPRLLTALAELLVADGSIALVDLDADREGAFHEPGFTGHHGFDRAVVEQWLADAGFGAIRFATPYQVVKEVNGQPRAFPLFLAVARRGA